MEQEIDVWIAQLSQCKQLSEADVKKLCDKVRLQIMHDPDKTTIPLSSELSPDGIVSVETCSYYGFCGFRLGRF